MVGRPCCREPGFLRPIMLATRSAAGKITLIDADTRMIAWRDDRTMGADNAGKMTGSLSIMTPTSFQVKRLSPHMAISVLSELLVSVIVVAALFPCAAPRIGLFNFTESEAPVGQGESAEDVTVSVQARTAWGCSA